MASGVDFAEIGSDAARAARAGQGLLQGGAGLSSWIDEGSAPVAAAHDLGGNKAKQAAAAERDAWLRSVSARATDEPAGDDTAAVTHSGGPAGVRRDCGVSMQLFDDETYETRTVEEWIALATPQPPPEWLGRVPLATDRRVMKSSLRKERAEVRDLDRTSFSSPPPLWLGVQPLTCCGHASHLVC